MKNGLPGRAGRRALAHRTRAARLHSKMSSLTHSRPMRVGIDVSPLAQTRAGTARYLRALLRELRPPEVEVSRFGFGGDGRAATLARELVWYPVGLPRVARRAGVDVLHCTTYRGPLQGGPPLVVTVHDLAVFRHRGGGGRRGRPRRPARPGRDRARHRGGGGAPRRAAAAWARADTSE